MPVQKKYDAMVFETQNYESPNFCKFNQNFNLDNKYLVLKSIEGGSQSKGLINC